MEFYTDPVDEGVLILAVDSGLLSDDAHRLEGELERYIALGIERLIVDCTNLNRISSFGLAILVSLHKRMAKKGGDVKLAAVSGFVGNMIHLTGLGALLKVYRTIDDARASFATASGRRAREPRAATRHPALPCESGEES